MATYTLLDPSVPAGAYDAIFVGTEKKAFKFGDRLIWQFEVEGGEHDGRTVNAFSGTLPTLRSNCGKFLAMLVGSTPEKDRSIDPDDCIGHQYRIRIEESAGGESTRVVAFELLASDQAPAEANDPPALPSDKVPF